MTMEKTAAQAESSAPTLDVDILRELRESLAARPGALTVIYRKFLANAALFIRDLDDTDGAARMKALHMLRGSAAMVGADRLAVLAARLQVELPSDRIAQAIELLERELACLRDALDVQLALEEPSERGT